MMKLLIIVVVIVGIASVAGTIYVGTETYERTVVSQPYEAGLAWDAGEKARADSGWQVVLDAPTVREGRADLVLAVLDRQRKSVTDAEVRLRLSRARVELAQPDHRLERMPDGRYHATVDLPLTGRWDAAVTVTRSGATATFYETFYAVGGR